MENPGPRPPGPRLDDLLSDSPLRITVRGTSMAPLLREGDVVEVVRASPEALRRGDLVVFVRADEITVHRFLGRRRNRFLEKGDGQAMGNWHPLPPVMGVVTRWKRGETWRELEENTGKVRTSREGRRHLALHILHRFVSLCPFSGFWERLMRAVGRLVRPGGRRRPDAGSGGS